MKKCFLLFVSVIFMFTVSNLNAQDSISESTGFTSQLGVSYNFGFPLNVFNIPESNLEERRDHMLARTVFDNSFLLDYKIDAMKFGKVTVAFGTGLGYTNTRHYQSIIDLRYSSLVENVLFDSKMLTIPIIVGVKYELIEDKLFLDLSYSLNYNIPLEKELVLTNTVENKYGFINYSYVLNVSNFNQITHFAELNAEYKLIDDLFFTAGVGFAAIKKVEYNYESSFLYYLTNQDDNTTTIYSASYESLSSIRIRDTYLSIGLGLAYRF